MRELAVGTSDGVDDGMVDYNPLIEVLGELRPPHLRAIHIGDWDEWEVSWTDAGDISPLWKLPRLERLTIPVTGSFS